MSGTRRALIVANDTYDHASFGQLRAPAADAEALADVLGDPEVGGFTVAVVHNEPSYEVQTRIEDVFADSKPEDLLLLHFSGHGVKSDTGELFVAARGLVALGAGGEEARQAAAAGGRGAMRQQDLDRGGAFAALVEQRGQRGFAVHQGFGVGAMGQQPLHAVRLGAQCRVVQEAAHTASMCLKRVR